MKKLFSILVALMLSSMMGFAQIHDGTFKFCLGQNGTPLADGEEVTVSELTTNAAGNYIADELCVKNCDNVDSYVAMTYEVIALGNGKITVGYPGESKMHEAATTSAEERTAVRHTAGTTIPMDNKWIVGTDFAEVKVRYTLYTCMATGNAPSEGDEGYSVTVTYKYSEESTPKPVVNPSPVVYVNTAGTLRQEILSKTQSLEDVVNLTVSGSLNTADFEILTDSLPNMEVLDMKGVSNSYLSCSFQENDKLHKVILPENLSEIPSNLFSYCTALDSIEIQKNCSYINEQAIYYCSNLKHIKIYSTRQVSGSSNSVYPHNYNVVLEYPEDYYYEYCYDNYWTSYFTLKGFPLGVNAAIGTHSDVSIEVSTEGTMREEILKKTSQLRDVEKLTIKGVMNSKDFYILNRMFVLKELNIENLNKNSLYNSEWASDGVFSYNKTLEKITLPSDLVNIPSGLFKECLSLKEVSIPSSVNTIGYQAFYGCQKMESISFPEGLTSIGSECFYNCSALKAITIPQGVTQIADQTFRNCISLSSITMHDGITNIGAFAFNGCTALVDFPFPEELTTIGESAFENCTVLDSITIPAKVTKIGGRAFWGTSGLKNIDIYAVNPPTMNYSSSYAENGEPFDVSSVPEVHLRGDAINNIAAYRSANCWKSLIVLAGNGVKLTVNISAPGTLGERVLMQTGYLADVNYLTVTGPMNATDVSMISSGMPYLLDLDMSAATCTEDFSSAFEGRSYLTNVKLPTGMTYLGSSAFESCSRLREVIIPEGVTSIGNDAMKYCRKLSNVSLPSTLTSISSGAFNSCRNLTSINLPRGLKNIGSGYNVSFSDYGTFANSGLKEVVIPDSVGAVGGYCFYGCSELHTVVLGKSITEIGNYAFQYTYQLKNITWNDKLTSIDENAFSCSGVESITFPNSLTALGRRAFSNCSELIKVVLPESLMQCENPFMGCEALTDIVCYALVPPTCVTYNNSYGENLTLSIFGTTDMRGRKLTVPTSSMIAYKLEPGWNSFLDVAGMDTLPQNINVYKDFTFNIPAAIIANHKPNIALTSSGALTVNGTVSMALGKFSLKEDTYWHSYSVTPFISNAEIIAEEVQLDLQIVNRRWAYVTFPFDVKVSDIETSNPMSTSWVIRTYSGENRAKSDSQRNWVDITANDTLKAGQGYVIMSQDDYYGSSDNYGTITFSITAAETANKNKIFAKESHIIPLQEYPSEFKSNRSWNFVGNPYPCYFNTQRIDFPAPITVWNQENEVYEAYSLKYDDYVLSPGEAFFVQRPLTGGENIVFNADGRMLTKNVANAANAPEMRRTQEEQQADVFYLTISNGNTSDRTCIAIDPKASEAYDICGDAAKMLSVTAAAQIYSIGDNVNMAINERPMGNGIVQLGCVFKTDGNYTIALKSDSNKKVILVDALNEQETDLTEEAYSFSAVAGTTDMRFSIRFDDNTTTAISNPTVKDTTVEITTLDGKQIYKGNDATVLHTLASGVYVVKENGKVRKQIVK